MFEILVISIAGILIVFGFLFILFLLLKAIEILASDKNDEKHKDMPILSKSSLNSKIVKEEEVAAILISLEDMALLDQNKKIIINQK